MANLPMSATVFALTLSACANAPSGISKMDPVRIQQVPSSALCYAYAFGVETRKPNAPAQAEIRRRGLDCSAEIAEHVSDCSKLAIVNPRNAPLPGFGRDLGGYIGTFSVRNTSALPMNFRLSFGVSVSTLQTVGAGETTSTSVSADPGVIIRDANGNISMRQQPSLQDCTVVPGHTRSSNGGRIPWD